MPTAFVQSTDLNPPSSTPTRKVTFSLSPPLPAPTDLRARLKYLDALLEPSPAHLLPRRSSAGIGRREAPARDDVREEQRGSGKQERTLRAKADDVGRGTAQERMDTQDSRDESFARRASTSAAPFRCSSTSPPAAPLAPDDPCHLLRHPSSSSSTIPTPEAPSPPSPFPSFRQVPTLLPPTFSTAGLPPVQHQLRHGSTIQILPPRALSDITSGSVIGTGGDIVLDLSKRRGFVYLCSGDSQQIAVFRPTYPCFSAEPAPLILVNPVATYTRSDLVRLGREGDAKEHLRAHRLVGKVVQALHSRRVLLSFTHTLSPSPAHHLPLDLKVTIYADFPPSYAFLYRPSSSSHSLSLLTGSTSLKIHVSPLSGTANATLSSAPPYSPSLSHHKTPAPPPSSSTRSYSFPLALFLSSPSSTPSSPAKALEIDRILSHLSLPLSSLSRSTFPSSAPASLIARDLVARVLEFALGEEAEELVHRVSRSHLEALRAVEARSGTRRGQGNDARTTEDRPPSLAPASQPTNSAPQDLPLPPPPPRPEPLEEPERALLRRLEQVTVGPSSLFSRSDEPRSQLSSFPCSAGHAAESSTTTRRALKRSEGPDERRCEPGLGWISRRCARDARAGERTSTVEYEVLFCDGEEVRLSLCSGSEGLGSDVGRGEVDRIEVWWKGQSYALDEPLPSSLRRRLPLVGEMLHLFLPS
ncbi:hypothetical protein JCM5296_001905 [Sporobolomyces johnsonii]